MWLEKIPWFSRIGVKFFVSVNVEICKLKLKLVKKVVGEKSVE